MNKRIIILTISFMLSKLLFADTTLDGAITKAAVDITGKCDAKSILVIDDFESPSQAMTLYIREQLADSIFAEEELVQIVTRENMDKVEKEFEFQNSGVASEKTILSVAERLGARFIVFGKMEEFNSSYILRVRMLDVKSGAYIFRKTYEFQYSQKTEQLLGRAPNYKKVSLSFLLEANKNSLDFIAPSAGFSFDYSPWRKISIGVNAAASYDIYEKNNDLLTLEVLGTLRFYIASLTGEPVTGIYTELQAGTSLFFVNSNIKPVFNCGSSIGYRFALNNFFIEPEIRFGYPYLFGCGIYVGMRF
jgi:TolB-like protein